MLHRKQGIYKLERSPGKTFARGGPRHKTSIRRRLSHSCLNQFTENAVGILHELQRLTTLLHQPVSEHHHLVQRKERAHTVGNGQGGGGTRRLRLHRRHQALFRLLVHVGRGLVEHQEPRPLQQCASGGEELALARAEVGTARFQLHLEPASAAHQGNEAERVQQLPHRLVTVAPAVRGEVEVQVARKEQWLLWDGPDLSAQVPQAQLRYVLAVEQDAASLQRHEAEERRDERGLARARAAADAERPPRRQVEAQALQRPDLGPRLAVGELHALEAQSGRAGQCPGLAVLGLTSELAVGGHPLHTHEFQLYLCEKLDPNAEVARHGERVLQHHAQQPC
mmetsp:Transcript_25940/g.81903  ORF Transcript_25940/g.81903 Transcript_25940/m.81903 type:complete len:338 (+) Transcript_25940:168-1181(+)